MRIYRDRRVWLAVGTVACNAAAAFALFSCPAPLLTEMSGLDEDGVPTVLVPFGVGSLIGTRPGSRTADSHLFGTMYAGITPPLRRPSRC